jgi:hypothetical protein
VPKLWSTFTEAVVSRLGSALVGALLAGGIAIVAIVLILARLPDTVAEIETHIGEIGDRVGALEGDVGRLERETADLIGTVETLALELAAAHAQIARLEAPDDFVRYEPGSGVRRAACAPGSSCPFELRVRRLPEALACMIVHEGSSAPRHELRSDRDGFIRRTSVTADAADDPGVKIELRDLSVIIPRTMPEGPAGYRLTTCHLGCPWDPGTPDCVTSPWFPFLVGDDAGSGALIDRPSGPH